MNCCGNHEDHKDEKDKKPTPGQTDAQVPVQYHTEEEANENVPAHNHKAHLLHMLVCCGLPLLILLVLPLIGYKGILLTIAPLICPIMMIAMIPMMMRGRNH